MNTNAGRQKKNMRTIIASAFCFLAFALFAVSIAHADPDLKFYWPFDEGTGTSTGALSGYPGTLYGGPTWTSGGGLTFDGINDYVRTNSTLTGSMGVSDQAYTLSASVRVNDPGESGNIIHISNSANGIGWCIAMLHIENGYFRAIGWDGGSVTAVDTVPAVVGQWYSIANTWSPETDTLDLYVNGIKVASTSMSTYVAANVPVYVFAGLNATGCSENQGWFKGDVKDVRIYSRAITEEEVDDNANASLGTISADFLPADNSIHVLTDTNLVMTFSTTTVATSTGAIGIYKTQDDSLVEEIDVSSGQIAISDDTVTINPSSNLGWNTEYYVSVPDTAFVDVLGNTYPGTLASTTWSFTTREEPQVFATSTIPANTIYDITRQVFGDSSDTVWSSVSASSDGDRLVAVGSGFIEGNDYQHGFIYTSIDGGESWQLSTSTQATLMSSVVSSADGMGIMAIGVTALDGVDTFGFIAFKSSDGGATWSTDIIREVDMDELSVIGDGMIAYMALFMSRITASSDLTKVYVTLYDRFMYSYNGGEDWISNINLAIPNQDFVFPNSISTSADGSKIVFSLSPLPTVGSSEFTSVIISEDYGQTWALVLNGDNGMIPFSATLSEDGSRLFVADASSRNMYISNDDGISWATSTNPDGYSWVYIAPSATGDGIVAGALRDVSSEFDDGLLWYRMVAYSSRDNGLTWTRQSEGEPMSIDGLSDFIFKQLNGNISGAYDLSKLGLAAFAKLYVITGEEPNLPDPVATAPIVSTIAPQTYISRVSYGCRDVRASNYNQFTQHIPSMCVYGISARPTNPVSTPTPSATSVVVPSSTMTAFGRNLTVGMTGQDVRRLQIFLNTSGFMVAKNGPGSPGKETLMYGSLTRNALARYQTAKGIKPAIGYFGPITRTKIQESSER